jgi:hypothetical protein
LSPGGYIYYGLHTSLLDGVIAGIFKVLVFDDEANRIRKAMLQEGFTEIVAKKHIRQHDEKASKWTQFLLNEKPYFPGLYDLVITWNNQNLIDITTHIAQQFRAADFFPEPVGQPCVGPLWQSHYPAGGSSWSEACRVDNSF